MTQNFVVGPETPLREIERMMAEQELQQAGKDLAPRPDSAQPTAQSSELAPQPNLEQALSEAEPARKEREEVDAMLKKEYGLSFLQVLVLDELGKGKSIAAAARKVEINAGTIHRWMREHDAFIRHHQTVRRELHASARTRLEGMLNRAIDAVDGQIGRGDGRLGLELLREMKVTPRSNEPVEVPSPAEGSERVFQSVQQHSNLPIRGADVEDPGRLPGRNGNGYHDDVVMNGSETRAFPRIDARGTQSEPPSV